MMMKHSIRGVGPTLFGWKGKENLEVLTIQSCYQSKEKDEVSLFWVEGWIFMQNRV